MVSRPVPTVTLGLPPATCGLHRNIGPHRPALSVWSYPAPAQRGSASGISPRPHGQHGQPAATKATSSFVYGIGGHDR